MTFAQGKLSGRRTDNDNRQLNVFVECRCACRSITNGKLPMTYAKGKLPELRGDDEACMSLVVGMEDQLTGLEIDLIYTVYADVDAISRRVIIRFASILSSESVGMFAVCGWTPMPSLNESSSGMSHLLCSGLFDDTSFLVLRAFDASHRRIVIR